jgi:hypothetical protein
MLVSVASAPVGKAQHITPFVRLISAGGDDSRRAFVAQPADSAATVRVDASPAGNHLRLQLLITAGT